MSLPIKVGFVGLSATGWAASALAPSLIHESLRDKYELVAVSTTSEESAKASAEKYSVQVGHAVKAYHGDTTLIASDPDIDLIAVSVKAWNHKAAVLPVIAQRKHFFLEWPAGVDLRESVEIAEAARAQGIKSFVGLQARSSKVIRKVKQLVESGIIGPVRSTTLAGFVCQELKIWPPLVTPESKVTVDKAKGSTTLRLGLGHQLDALTFVVGDFATINATATTLYPTASVVGPDGKLTGETLPATSHDQYTISGLLSSGAIATIIWRTGYKAAQGRKPLRWEIDGENGVICVESDTSPFMNVSAPDVYLNGEKVYVDLEGAKDTVPRVIDMGPTIDILRSAWEAYAEGEHTQYATMDDAVKNHRTLDAIERSVTEGKTIAL